MAGETAKAKRIVLGMRDSDKRRELAALPALSPIDATANLPPAAAAGSTGGARDEK